MTTEEKLYGRALRILTDGRKHAPQATTWARTYTEARQRSTARELERAGFNVSEISLGAAEVVR